MARVSLPMSIRRKISYNKPWSTLRNLSKQHLGGSSRRLAREAKVILPESGSEKSNDLADILSAELESRELMLQAVNQLAKPYRDTINLHYMDGRSLKEIDATVRSPLP